MNTKVLFVFSGGFVPKSIRKICTLHQYEFENLALLKLSHCFSPTQHISKNVKLKVNTFILAILSVSQWCITLIFFFWSVYFDLGPVKDHDILQKVMIWKWLPRFESAEFYSSLSNLERCHYACARTHSHTQHTPLWSPALACPCSSHCLQTELPWKPLAGLSNANQSSHTLAFLMLPATNTSAISNIKPDNNLSGKLFLNVVNSAIILYCRDKSFIQG